MKRRMNKRMAAAALAGAMVLSMNGMAWAEVTEFNLTKEVTTDGKTHAPNTTFSFTITEGNEGTLGTAKVYAGVAGGLTLDTANNAFSFAPEADTSATYTKTGKINVNVGVFEKPGVYHYLVTETQGTYDGITYDVTPRHLYVFVVNATNGYEVDAIKVVKDGETAKADNLKIVNSYGDGTQDDAIHDFIIKKTVTGNQGDKNKEFSFTVTIDGDDADKEGAEKYMAVKTSKTDGEETIHITDGVTQTFTLMDSETLHIYGLSEKDKYTVTETDYSADGYTTTVKEDNAEGTLTADGITVEFINDKQVGPATGVAMTFAPYVLLVAAAGGLGAVVLGKKKREDDEI
ncbi:MAG: Spy0128 family protein [Monoglobales bacterium]